VDVTAEELHDADRFLAVADAVPPSRRRRSRRCVPPTPASPASPNPNAGSVAIADPTAMEDAVWTAVDEADLRAWVDSRPMDMMATDEHRPPAPPAQ
jgi:hypothetical protein